jgi:hypothetical protein
MSAAPPPWFPVFERPLTLLGIADGAFALMRARPRTVAGIVAAFVLPSQFLTVWLQREALSALSFDNFDTATGTFEGDAGEFGVFAGGPVAIAVPLIVLPFIGVALTHLVLGWREGEDRSISQCLLFTLRRAHLILAALVVSKIVQGLTLLIATPITMIVAPVLAAEGTGPMQSLRRANQLARPRFGNLVGLLFLLLLINALLNSALTTLPVIGALFLSDWGWVAFFALSLVSTSVLNVLSVGASILAYLDLRNRVEGADLQRRVESLAEATASGRSPSGVRR